VRSRPFRGRRYNLDRLDRPKKRAVGFKLSELAGTIRGSFFVIEGEY
jgi:hypothetical protein